MKLLFKERVFSWLDSYDIYDANNEMAYRVEGRLAWGHRLEIFDKNDELIGEVQEKVLSLLPCFHLFYKGTEIAMIEKEFSFFHPRFRLSCNDWRIEGDIWEWDYDVVAENRHIMHAHKEVFHFSDTYTLDIDQAEDQVLCLMIVLAIDAAKCAQNK